MQGPVRRRRTQPQLAGQQEIQSRAEAGFAHGKSAGSRVIQLLPSLLQTVVFQKYIATLGQAVIAGKIDIAVVDGTGNAVLPVEFCGDDKIRMVAVSQGGSLPIAMEKRGAL